MLERGFTHDDAFEAWVRKEAGQKALSYKLHRCGVSEDEAFLDLDANARGHALERITLAHEGFERDAAVRKPKEAKRP